MMQSRRMLAVMGIAAVGVLLAVAVFMLRPRSPAGEILVLCGGSMRPPMEDLISAWKVAHPDAKIAASYGGSAEFLAQIQMANRGDIFVCHDPFMPWAAAHDLIAEWFTAAYLDVAIAVPKGNPKGIHSLEDLARPGIRLGIGDRKHSTTGVIAASIIRQVPYGKSLLKNVALETHGAQRHCTAVATGALDAAIVWAPVARQFSDELDIIPLPEEYLDAVTSATYGKSDLRNVRVTIGLISRAASRDDVRQFYEFLKARSPEVFAKYGYRIHPR